MAQYGQQLPRFFKRYQIQPVWRADRPAKGRFREFSQCDVDMTGTTSLLAEAEVINAVCGALLELGFSDFSVALNHRVLLRSMIEVAAIDPALEGSALVAHDKLDKIGATALPLTPSWRETDAGLRDSPHRHWRAGRTWSAV